MLVRELDERMGLRSKRRSGVRVIGCNEGHRFGIRTDFPQSEQLWADFTRPDKALSFARRLQTGNHTCNTGQSETQNGPGLFTEVGQ